uniref:Uncharacterized protein n=1 Tax=Lactuca sativa TaxID=4236 RepID=A0A9R1WMX2_LACSA|nr:hypothetical protein LSAT_V11C100020360 [Lactuca sativa]
MSAAWRSRGKMPQFYVDNDVSFAEKKRGFKGDIPPVEAGVRAASWVGGSCVASSQVVSRHWSAAVDSALEEDIGGSTIGRCFCQKYNTDPLLSKSPIVIDIVDGDDPQTMEMVGLRRLGEPSTMGTRPVPPLVSGDALSAVGPSYLGAPGVYLLGWNVTPGSLLLEQGPAHEWCRHTFPSATLEALDVISYSHMANDLQYATVQIAPYLVAAAGRLRYIWADFSKVG